jgi:hypothetical protein
VTSDRLSGPVALVGGSVAVISAASLAAFFVVGGPFGAINDWTIGVYGLLAGVLAVSARQVAGAAGQGPGRVAIALAVAGAATVVLGSYLVISDTTGFLLAGLIESVGFALIGVWLIVLNRSLVGAPQWPRRLPALGIAAGVVMTVGFIVVPGIAAGMDDASAAPAWVWIGFVGWIGIFFLYPAWSIWFGLGRRIWPDSVRTP